MRQSQMPFFPTVNGDFAQLCVFTARGQDCSRKDCAYCHELKLRRPCRFFHSKSDYCRDGDACLLGHQEARDAYNQYKQAKARKAKHQPQEPATTGQGTGAAAGGTGAGAGAVAGAGAGAVAGAGAGAVAGAGAWADDANNTQPLFNNPHVALLPPNPANPIPNQIRNQSVIPSVPASNQNVPPVHFQQLAQANDIANQTDEITRLNIRQEEMLREFENFRRQSAAKEDEIHLLQTSMDEMQSENEKLKTENNSKPPNGTGLLDRYYEDAFGQASDTRSLLDLEQTPLSEKALEGALVMMATLYSRPLEFSGNTKVIDLLNDRPETRFSSNVPTLSSLGLDDSIPEHAFFLECYMKFLADPSFCKDGKADPNSAIVSMPPGGAFPPRASVIKKFPRKFRNIFSSQQSSPHVSANINKNLSLKPGGGLLLDDHLPSVIHTLLCRFASSNCYKNPAVPMSSQFLMYIQNGLSSLDKALLKYESPVYKACPFKLRTYQNGNVKFLKLLLTLSMRNGTRF
jgi:hypothetical protein